MINQSRIWNPQEDLQVDADHYSGDYISSKRMASIGEQYERVMKCAPTSVLEVGVGAGILKFLFARNDVYYQSVDIDPALNPSHIGSVLDLPLEDDSFDVVCCFQVLEHLPFSDFKRALSELCRVSSKHVILSLPEPTPWFSFGWLFVSPREINAIWSICSLPRCHRSVDGQHKWEIGRIGTPLKLVRKTMQDVNPSWDLVSDKRFFLNPYHHFFHIIKRPR